MQIYLVDFEVYDNRNSRPGVFFKKGALRNFVKFTGKHLRQSRYARVSFATSACNFNKKETLAKVFSCEFCEISKNTFSYRTPLVAASDDKSIANEETPPYDCNSSNNSGKHY